MSTNSDQEILNRLKNVKYPGFSRDIVSFGLVKQARLQDGTLDVLLALSTPEPAIAREIKEGAEKALAGFPGAGEIRVRVDVQAPVQTSGAPGPQGIDGVKYIVAVASGKGGVGKSTVAANLALGLTATGCRTGLCDCDIYGPSAALLFGSNERPYADENDRILPILRHDVQLMSMGFLLEDDSPAVLRGPMVTRYTQQFLRQVAWDNLDYLVLDLPPGTGDIQLTVVQTVALAGAVIVTTPQEMALIDARKACAMFGKTSVRVLGIVENMSYFLCPGDGKAYDIFGTGGGEREALRLGVPLLAKLPIEPSLREASDIGLPLMVSSPESSSARAFLELAQKVRAAVEA